jgi:hypothetical protein
MVWVFDRANITKKRMAVTKKMVFRNFFIEVPLILDTEYWRRFSNLQPATCNLYHSP